MSKFDKPPTWNASVNPKKPAKVITDAQLIISPPAAALIREIVEPLWEKEKEQNARLKTLEDQMDDLTDKIDEMHVEQEALQKQLETVDILSRNTWNTAQDAKENSRIAEATCELLEEDMTDTIERVTKLEMGSIDVGLEMGGILSELKERVDGAGGIFLLQHDELEEIRRKLKNLEHVTSTTHARLHTRLDAMLRRFQRIEDARVTDTKNVNQSSSEDENEPNIGNALSSIYSQLLDAAAVQDSRAQLEPISKLQGAVHAGWMYGHADGAIEAVIHYCKQNNMDAFAGWLKRELEKKDE